MALLTWTDDYSVKIKRIDDQHKNLVKLINDLHEGMRSGKGKEALGTVLSELVEYTKTHFAAEEKMMQDHGYAGYLKQKIEHDALTKKVVEINANYQSGKTTLSIDVMSFLKDWLIKHIQGSDKLYSGYLNGKGVH